MAKRHYANYKELPRDLSAQSKALWHPQKAEPALEAALQDLQDIIEFLPDAIIVIDREKKVIYWNRAMEEMTGVDKRNILGKSDCAYAVPFYGEKRPMLIDLVMAEEPEIENRYEFVKKIGKTIYGEAFVPGAYQGKGAYLQSTAAPLIGRDGSIIGFVQSIRDISDRKRAEEAVRQSEEKYRQLFETVSDAILVFDGRPASSLTSMRAPVASLAIHATNSSN